MCKDGCACLNQHGLRVRAYIYVYVLFTCVFVCCVSTYHNVVSFKYVRDYVCVYPCDCHSVCLFMFTTPGARATDRMAHKCASLCVHRCMLDLHLLLRKRKQKVLARESKL